VQLSKFIQVRTTPDYCLVLAHLNSSQAAAAVEFIAVLLRADVVMRMANLEQISPGRYQ